MNHKIRIMGAGVGLLALLGAIPVWSASLQPINLPEMVDQADRIFLGRVVDEWTGRDETGIPATITTFEVTGAWKGQVEGIVRIKQLGVTEIQPDGLATRIEGMPRYRRGSEYLLFFPPDSRIGFTSPVGMFQGSFEIGTAEKGSKSVLNGVDNANLVRGLEPEHLNRLGLFQENFPFVSRKRGPMHLDELIGMIERLQGIR